MLEMICPLPEVSSVPSFIITIEGVYTHSKFLIVSKKPQIIQPNKDPCSYVQVFECLDIGEAVVLSV